MPRNWDHFLIELTEHYLLYKVVSHYHLHFYHVYKLYNHLYKIESILVSDINDMSTLSFIIVESDANLFLGKLIFNLAITNLLVFI